MTHSYFTRAIGVLIVTACFACNAENHANSKLRDVEQSRPIASGFTVKPDETSLSTIAKITGIYKLQSDSYQYSERKNSYVLVKDPSSFREITVDAKGNITSFGVGNGIPFNFSDEDHFSYSRNYDEYRNSGFNPPTVVEGVSRYSRVDLDDQDVPEKLKEFASFFNKVKGARLKLADKGILVEASGWGVWQAPSKEQIAFLDSLIKYPDSQVRRINDSLNHRSYKIIEPVKLIRFDLSPAELLRDDDKKVGISGISYYEKYLGTQGVAINIPNTEGLDALPIFSQIEE